MAKKNEMTKKELICRLTDKLAEYGVLVDEKTVKGWGHMTKEALAIEAFVRLSIARNGADAPIVIPGPQGFKVIVPGKR